MNKYAEFIRNKAIISTSCGFDIDRVRINPMLFEFQRDIVHWALIKGRAALFTMTGTGKTLMQLEWARLVYENTGENILVLAPLAVSHQTMNEGKKIGIDVHVCRTQSDVKPGINITNYEMLQHFDADAFGGIVLDESSILKSFESKTRNMIIDSFAHTGYRLACTATPAPNDFMELGNHSEFLGVMSRTEMLSMFFVHDGGNTSQWRLKGHAVKKYWEWLSSWAVVLTKPSDLGYEDGAFELPSLNIHERVIPIDTPIEGMLFAMPATSLMERRQARRDTTTDRVTQCAEIVNNINEPFLVWCDLNYESQMLTKEIGGAIEVKGADSREYKEKAMDDFTQGNIRVLVTKPSIAGFGMNWQHCRNMAFVGLSDSFEQYFQAVRRCWRFGQTEPVNVYIITSELEGNVVANIKRKELDAMKMIDEMTQHTRNIMADNIRHTVKEITEYTPSKRMELPSWI